MRYFDIAFIGQIPTLFGGNPFTINLLDTGWAMYLPAIFAAGIRSGLFVFIYRQFFLGLPAELEDAAISDGEEVTPAYFCGLDAHAHIEECFDENGNLNCLLEEHSHNEECFAEPETESAEETQVFYCGLDAHIHVEECFDENGNPYPKAKLYSVRDGLFEAIMDNTTKIPL